MIRFSKKKISDNELGKYLPDEEAQLQLINSDCWRKFSKLGTLKKESVSKNPKVNPKSNPQMNIVGLSLITLIGLIIGLVSLLSKGLPDL